MKTIRYIRANTRMLELEQARLKNEYLEKVTQLSKLDLLAIDDFRLMELDLDKCRDLFEVIDGRDFTFVKNNLSNLSSIISISGSSVNLLGDLSGSPVQYFGSIIINLLIDVRARQKRPLRAQRKKPLLSS